MAAVLLVLRKKQEVLQVRRQCHIRDANPVTCAEEHVPIETNENSKSEFEYEQISSRKIQKTFRGYMARKAMLLDEDLTFDVSHSSVRSVTALVLKQVAGWNRLLIHLVVVVIFALMVYAQLFSSHPPVRDTQRSLRLAFEQTKTTGGFHYSQVRSSSDLIRFTKSLGSVLYSGDPRLSSIIGYTSTENVSSVIPADEVSVREQLAFTENSGYLDNYNRIQLGLVVVQTRREMVDCAFDSVTSQTYENIRFSNNLVHRGCGTSIESKTFVSEHVDVNDLISQGQTAFKYQKDLGFLTALGVGVFNLGLAYLHYEVDMLAKHWWFDEATEKVCYHLMVHNQNGLGRTTSGSLCFNFSLGGGTSSQLKFRSTSSLSTQNQIGGITLASILLCLWLYRIAGLVSRQYKRKSIFIDRIDAVECIILALEASVLVLYVADIMIFARVVENPNRKIEFDSFESNLPTFIVQLLELEGSIDYIHWYKIVLGVLLMAYLWNTIFLLDFNESLSIVTRTIGRATEDLLNFFIVATLITVSYAVAGHFLLSDVSDAFQGIGDALAQLLLCAVGDYGDTKAAVFNQNLSTGVATLSTIYFFSYIFMVTLLLLNVLLSIIVDSFVTIQTEKKRMVVLTTFQSISIWFSATTFDLGIARFTTDTDEGGSSILKAVPQDKISFKAVIDAVLKLSDPETTSLQLRKDFSEVLSPNVVNAIVRHARDLHKKEEREKKDRMEKVTKTLTKFYRRNSSFNYSVSVAT